ncbi:MAG: polysaccharide biosynthesis C-terminal domain-containing protein [Bacteroidetes bacterium]|nr:polysaccharide biosynthesis C-terminal domain-containing protein [Bacteroidota bacterium]
MSNPLKKLAGQTVVYGIGSILPRIINYLFSLALTYIFKTPSDLASNTEFYAYISFVNIIFTYGFETAFFNFSNKLNDKEKVYSTALISLLTSSLVFTLVTILFKNNLANVIGYPNNSEYVTWCILIVATDTLMALPFAKYRLNNQAKKFAGLKLLNVFIYLLVSSFYLVFCKNAFENNENNFLSTLYNPIIGVGYAFLAQLIANLICIIFMYKSFIINYVFDFNVWKQLINYSWPLLILGLAGMTNETFDRIIIKKLLPTDVGQTELGIYGACYKISILMTIFIQAFKYAAEPFFFNTSNDKNSKQLNAVVMKYFVIFCLFLFLVTMMNIDIVIKMISEQYRVGVGVAPILLMANLCLGIFLNLSIWYKLTNQTKFGAVITIIGAIITLVINFIFVPKYSYMASAWATLISYASMMVLSYYLGKKYYPIKYNLRSIFLFFGLALLLYFISFLWNDLQPKMLKLILNNLLVLFYLFTFYKLEFKNLLKLKKNVIS